MRKGGGQRLFSVSEFTDGKDFEAAWYIDLLTALVRRNDDIHNIGFFGGQTELEKF